MPTYNFHCESCQQEFKEQMPFGSSLIPECPKCKKHNSVRKIMKPPMVQFKGSGFYKNDSAPAAKPVAPKSEAPKTEVKETPKPVEKKTENTEKK